MDRLTEMEAFATVVDQGGFTDAAKKLGMSKSAVSKHVTALEARLGARLLNRTTRRVSPTEIGLAYYDRARRVLSDAGEADALVSAWQAGPSGTLRLSVDADFGSAYLSHRIGEFLSDYPEITVQMDLTDSRTPLPEGFDLAIRVGAPDGTNLTLQPLSETALHLIAAPDYLERAGHPQELGDLRDHRLLHHSKSAADAVWNLTTASGAPYALRLPGWLTVNDGRSLLRACISGLGIAHLPRYICAEALATGQVVNVLPDLPAETVQIYAIQPPEGLTPPKVRAFLGFLSDHLNRTTGGAGLPTG